MEQDIDDINKLDEALAFQENDVVHDLQDQLNEILISEDDEAEEINRRRTNWCINQCANIDKFSELDLLIDNIDQSLDINYIKHYINSEELNIILQCKDEKLKTIMILNRLKLIQLKNLEVQVNNLYHEFLSDNKLLLCKPPATIRKKRFNLGYPYFKTLNHNTCPLNSDAIKKKDNGEIWIDYLKKSTNWTRSDLIDLKRGIAISYFKYQISQLEKRLNNLKNTLAETKNKKTRLELIKRISVVEREIKKKKCEKINTYPPLHNDRGIDWLHISTEELNNRHLVTACKGIWNIFLHPSLNKSKWTESEARILLKLCKKHLYSNWEMIAKELKTNRSPFAVCVQYYAGIEVNPSLRYFTPEEDKKLLDIINICKIGDYIPWNKVSSYFADRTKTQLWAHYKTKLSYDNTINKGRFSKAEDILLYCLVQRHGKDFKLCERVLKTRNSVQLRVRYNNFISCFNKLLSGNWTFEEDEIIIKHLKNEETFSPAKLAKILNRTQGNIRHRSVLIRNWQFKNPNKPPEELPRRMKGIHFYDEYNNEILEIGNELLSGNVELTLKNVQDILDKKSKKKGRPVEFPRNISRLRNDHRIIDYFKTSIITNDGFKKEIDENLVDKYSKVIMYYLNFFKVKMDIPDDLILETNTDLDEMDLMLLSHIREIKQENSDYSINNLVSPNVNTLLGLRVLLSNFMNYKDVSSNSDRLRYYRTMAQFYNNLTDVERENCVKLETCFIRRFNSVFGLPSLMSTIKRPSITIESLKYVINKKLRPVGRPKKDLSKIYKMNQAKVKAQLDKNASNVKIDGNEECIRKKLSSGQSTSSNKVISAYPSIMPYDEIQPTFNKKATFTYANRKRSFKSEELVEITKCNENIVNSSAPNQKKILQDGSLEKITHNKEVPKQSSNTLVVNENISPRPSVMNFKNIRIDIAENGSILTVMNPCDKIIEPPPTKKPKLISDTFPHVLKKKSDKSYSRRVKKNNVEQIVFNEIWSLEEDEKLLPFCEYNDFNAIIPSIKHFNKSKESIEHRYKLFRKWRETQECNIAPGLIYYYTNEYSKILPFDIIDAKLIDCFKYNSLKGHENIPLEKYTNKVDQILKRLDARLSIPNISVLRDTPGIDAADLFILKNINSNDQKTIIKEYLPPNLLSLTALQLLLKHFAGNKSKFDLVNMFRFNVDTSKCVNNIEDQSKKTEIIYHLELLRRRMNMIFTWPFVISSFNSTMLSIDKQDNYANKDCDNTIIKSEYNDISDSNCSLSNLQDEESIDIKLELKDIDLLDSVLKEAV